MSKGFAIAAGIVAVAVAGVGLYAYVSGQNFLHDVEAKTTVEIISVDESLLGRTDVFLLRMYEDAGCDVYLTIDGVAVRARCRYKATKDYELGVVLSVLAHKICLQLKKLQIETRIDDAFERTLASQLAFGYSLV